MIIPEAMNGGPHYRSRRIPGTMTGVIVALFNIRSIRSSAKMGLEAQFYATAFSINYLMSEADLDLQDPNSAMKIFEDPNAASGNVIERHFCSVCGSAIFSKTPRAPGKVFLKATLFDKISPMEKEVFGDRRLPF
ncbi:hypothetical protein N7493_003911 [Penicillium malachiteum]|uniref:CENP-V/GFA domain-containing protein n=1 Tax=Penicillium malachiteum TaxID=1324776 RepID=A0AAD6HQI7_9EURO|nr:hypothetical protein N7493_003911 [Penicillium malachiteum]